MRQPSAGTAHLQAQDRPLNHLLVTLYGRYMPEAAPAGPAGVPEGVLSRAGPNPVGALNLELATYGYTLGNALAQHLAGLEQDAFMRARSDLHGILQAASGGGSYHTVLFAKFPYGTPDQWEYLAERAVGYARMRARGDVGFKVLRSGLVVGVSFPEGHGEGIDRTEFGVDPVTQFAVPGLRAAENARHAYERMLPLRALDLATPGWVATQAATLLGRGSSLSMDERAFLEASAAYARPALPAALHREAVPLAYALHGEDDGAIRPHLRGATDVLRIAAYLGDRKADLSLAAPARFRLRTGQRKAMLRLLHGLPNLGEDMLRHREAWLRLGERLAPGREGNRSRYPDVARAFDSLRDAPEEIPSFNRTVERGLRRGADPEAVLAARAALQGRPGELVRRLDWLLRRHGQDALDCIGAVASKAKPRALFGLHAYLRARLADIESGRVVMRAFPIKGASSRVKVVEDTRRPLPAEVARRATEAVRRGLQERLSGLPPLGKVWQDPELREVVMPWNRRGDSASASAATRDGLPITKGSSYPLHDWNLPVLRMFVHWTGHVDVDLSVNVHDADWGLLASVGYYNSYEQDNLGKVVVHSGDVQDAPEGASEFVDVDLPGLARRFPIARYLVASVISYRGQRFGRFPCYAGYMERDALRSGRRYEPESVSVKFDLGGGGTSAIPMAFDLAERRMICMDLAAGGGRFNHALGQNARFAGMARAVAEMRLRRVTAWDVWRAHAAALGTLAGTPDEADLRVYAAGLDLDATERMMDEPPDTAMAAPTGTAPAGRDAAVPPG